MTENFLFEQDKQTGQVHECIHDWLKQVHVSENSLQFSPHQGLTYQITQHSKSFISLWWWFDESSWLCNNFNLIGSSFGEIQHSILISPRHVQLINERLSFYRCANVIYHLQNLWVGVGHTWFSLEKGIAWALCWWGKVNDVTNLRRSTHETYHMLKKRTWALE